MATTYGGRWRVVGTLGEGGQAHTFHVRDEITKSTGFVLKRLINVHRTERFDREVAALQEIRGPGIPDVVDYGVDAKGRGFVVTPYLGQDLTRVQLDNDIPFLLTVFREVVLAAAAAHSAGVVHRDIKPNNIVMDSAGSVSLIDFGICTDVPGGGIALTTANEGFGNRSFAAPECEAGSMENASAASDVYSLGKLLYWMTSGRRLMVRERLDASTIVTADEFERWCIEQLISRTVMEEVASRWTSDELLVGIDWALRKIEEHRQEIPGRVLVDGFGPEKQYNGSGSRSATTPPRGNPPAINHVGQAFRVDRETHLLSRLELALSRRAGDGNIAVRLADEEDGQPGATIVSWDLTVTSQTADAEAVVTLKPSQDIALSSNRRYWVYVVATTPSADVAWWLGDQMLNVARSTIGEMNMNPPWRVNDVRGVGYALKVVAIPDGAGSPRR